MATQTLVFKSTPNCDGVKLFDLGSDTVVATAASVVMGSNNKAFGSCTVTDVPAGLYVVACFAGSTPVWVQYVDLLLADGTYHCRETIEADVRISTRAAPGDEMALADDAITSSKYDETTAYPLKSADSGSTAVARTGANGDTLKTLSDQLDTAQSDLDLITGTDGATLATSQPNYAPAKAGAKMDLVDAPNATAVTAIQNGLSTFDPAEDAVARVTLVDTCTTNTDMRGTDGAVTSVPSETDIATAVWSASTRTLSSFGTLVSDIATAVWGATTRTLSAFSHKVTVQINEDKTGYALSTEPPTAEEVAEQVRTELTPELGRLDQPVSSRLAPTTAGRTINVDESGSVVATAEVSEESIRDAMGLEEGQRVATPEDIAVNVTVTPLSVTTPKDIEQSTLYLRLEDSSEYRIEEVKGSDGNLADLSLIANLELVIESFDEVEVEVITDLELINDNHGVAFSPSVAVQTATYPPKHHLWALRDPDDGNRVLAGGPCVVTRYAKKA